MKKLAVALFTGALLVVLWTPVALGQALPSLPIASVPNPVCGKYLTLIGSLGCGYTAHYPWFAVGGGWSTATSFTNPAGTTTSYNLYFVPAEGNVAGANYVPVNDSAFGRLPTPFSGIVDFSLNGYASSDDVFTSVTGGLQTGSVCVLVFAPDAATLDAQKAAQLTFIYTPTDGSPTLQVGVPLVRDSDASVAWGSQVTETPIAMKANNPASNNSSFAVLNLSGQTQSVLVTISDNNNNLIVEGQTDPLAPGATAGIVLANMFQNTTFPNSQDGLFHGNISFRGMGGGNIVPLVLRVIGNSISSMLVWQTPSN